MVFDLSSFLFGVLSGIVGMVVVFWILLTRIMREEYESEHDPY